MSTPSASVCERDFRSQEALRYSRPYHRMRKVPRRVTSGRGVGVPACRRRMRNGHAFLCSSTRTPLLTVSIWRVSNGRPSPSRVPPASPSQRVHAYGNIRHSAEFSRTLAEHFAVESRLPTAHNASCGALRTGQRLPMREGCRARPPRRGVGKAKSAWCSYGAVSFDVIVDLRSPPPTLPTPLSVSVHGPTKKTGRYVLRRDPRPLGRLKELRASIDL